MVMVPFTLEDRNITTDEPEISVSKRTLNYLLWIKLGLAFF